MTKRVFFHELAAGQFRDFLVNQPRIALKIFDLMKSIEINPFDGIGKPEQLKHNLRGLWSRRITGEHHLVYKVENDIIVILSCFGHYTP